MNFSTKFRPTFVISFILSVFLMSTGVKAQDGKKLFKSNCASCHAATDKKLIGPGLQGVSDRWPDKAKLYAWIKNSQEFLKTGDAYANKLYNDYNKSQMTAFPDLTDGDIDAILAYIANPADGTTTTTTGGGDPEPAPIPADDSATTNLIISFLVILLLILTVVLRNVGKSLQTLVNDKQGIPNVEAPRMTIGQSIGKWMANNKPGVAVIVVIVLVSVLKVTYDSLMAVGVYTNYAPEQPIKFSHKVHAGQNGIACQYCHVGVEKSKHAVIPSANICMNCHKAVKEGPITGTEEIAKIYTALDYNPETGVYGNNPTPIKWVKIHNLPDHVYFNHSQHVKVGKVECTTCHGEVEKMEVVNQHSPLTMGWCINCHRETEVKTEGNAYYDEFHARLTDELKKKYLKDGKITVSEIGGLECAKCHY